MTKYHLTAGQVHDAVVYYSNVSTDELRTTLAYWERAGRAAVARVQRGALYDVKYLHWARQQWAQANSALKHR